MARISEPALGVSRAMARYGWYRGGVEGLYGGVGVFVNC